jgi:type I restriction-modification system DNA methylase subunit
MVPQAKSDIKTLVQKFSALTKKEKHGYNEANTANVFIRPLFENLGWDFSDLDEVEAEKAIVKGRVDYLFKLNKVSKFCVEVKSLNHELTDSDRQQAIGYAYNKGVTWAILTNFAQLQVFNAEVKTDLKDALFLNLSAEDYVESSEDLVLLSKQSASEGKLDKKAEKYGKLAKRAPVVKRLYEQLAKWREPLFNAVHGFNKDKNISLDDTDRLVQKFFSRLIFIRTAEDRGLAGNHPLLAAVHQWEGHKGTFDLLGRIVGIFGEFAAIFDSEAFPTPDPWAGIEVNDNQLIADIVNGLYQVPGDIAVFDFNVIEPDVLGQVYEQYLAYVNKVVKVKAGSQLPLLASGDSHVEISAKEGKRKKGGIYYTPKWVTDYVVRQTVGRFASENGPAKLLNIRILDLACGSGSFLIRAYDELLKYHAKLKHKTVAELDWNERIDILHRNIFGVDLDPQAVEIARLNLLLRALAKQDQLPKLENNIRCGNSLIFGTDKEMEALAKTLKTNVQALNPLNWGDKFPEARKAGGFDIVIGNPPYIMELRDNSDVFAPLRASPLGAKYYEAKMDVFYFFIEHGIDLLKERGYLGYIVMQYWLSRTHASKLRKKIFAETTPLVLVDFDDYTVFENATGQHNMIAILRKVKVPGAKTLIMHLKDSELDEAAVTNALALPEGEQTVFDALTVETAHLYDANTDKVHLASDATLHLLDKLSTAGLRLDDAEIQEGLVTPQHALTAKALVRLPHATKHQVGEGIFVLDKSEVKALGLTRIERKLLKPFHYAEELDAFYYDPKARQFVIYTPAQVAKDIEADSAKYLKIRAHLDAYQSVITSDRAPYGIHRARQPEWFEDPAKIIAVRKTKYPKFVVVPNRWYGDQAVLIIRLTKHPGISPHYVAAILNSNVAHFWLFQQKRQGNQLQVDKEVLLNFPIPNIDLENIEDKKTHDAIVSAAQKAAEQQLNLKAALRDASDIFGDKRKKIQADLDKTLARLNELVNRAYALSARDAAEIRRFIEKLES